MAKWEVYMQKIIKGEIAEGADAVVVPIRKAEDRSGREMATGGRVAAV
jgi:hypothetical protein